MFWDSVEMYHCISVSVYRNGKIFLQNQTENLVYLSKQILQKEICARWEGPWRKKELGNPTLSESSKLPIEDARHASSI